MRRSDISEIDNLKKKEAELVDLFKYKKTEWGVAKAENILDCIRGALKQKEDLEKRVTKWE